MCYAIIEVKYRNNADPQDTIKVVDDADLFARVTSLQNKENVERITVFMRNATFTRTSTWVQQTHTE